MPLWVKVIVYTVCFAVVVGLVYYGFYAIDSRGYKRGVNETEAIWRTAQVEAKEEQIEAIQQWRDALRLQGIELQAAVTDLGEQQLEEIKNVEHGKNMLLDAIYAGRIKLHIPTEKGTGNGSISGRSTDETDLNITQAGCVGETRGELPIAATAFLYGESGRANELVGDYNYLVDYTNLIRATCGEWLEKQE